MTHARKVLIPNARAARYVAGDSIVYAIGTTIKVVLNWFLEMKSPATRSERLAAHHSR